MPERRVAKVAIHFDLLFQWLTQDNEIRGLLKTTKGLPKDAKYVGSMFDQRTMEAWLIFAHDSFPLIVEGGEIPYYAIEFTQYREESRSNEVVSTIAA